MTDQDEADQTFRQELEYKVGKTWATAEMLAEFSVSGFCMSLAMVIRKSDGVEGTLDFTHMPRFYHSFVENKR